MKYRAEKGILSPTKSRQLENSELSKIRLIPKDSLPGHICPKVPIVKISSFESFLSEPF